MGEHNNGDLTQKTVFTTGEAAELCRVSQQTVIRCFDNGRLQGFRVPGSRFRRIPKDALIRFMQDNQIPTEGLTGASRQRVLVVDDDPAIVEMFQDVLEKDSGLEIESAANGYDAGLVTHRFRPDLMILDYMLPDINGRKVIQSIRTNPAFDQMKIILVSGVVDRDQINDLLDAGADEFIKKPIDLQHLLERIDGLLRV